MMNKTGIYKITNLINGKFYIGSAARNSFKDRWSKGYANNKYLTSSLKKYGKENFKFEVLLVCEPQDCLKYEQLYLDNLEPWIETGKGYNICKTAYSRLGTKITEQTRINMRLSHKGCKPTFLNKKHTMESKLKMSTSKINKLSVTNIYTCEEYIFDNALRAAEALNTTCGSFGYHLSGISKRPYLNIWNMKHIGETL